MTVKLDTQDKKMNTILWIVGLAFASFLGIGAVQLINFGQVREQTISNTTEIDRIRGDYLPYFAFQYIVESNNKLMNLLTAIDSKNDEKYQKAIKEWSDLQQEVIKQAGKNKTRSGGSSSILGGQ